MVLTRTLLGGLILLGAAPLAQAADSYKLDQEHSDVVFLIDHFGYSKTVGRFNGVDGTITMDEADLASGSIELTIDAASIDTNHEKRDEHLRSPDFFNAAEFPTITFKSTAIEPTGEQSGKVTGDLTLLGVTRPVTLDATLNQIAPHPVPDYEGVVTAGFSASGSIDRTEFGMETYAPAIGSEVDLIIELEAFKQ
jgi:polyisoprenoid-binding protein YceI